MTFRVQKRMENANLPYPLIERLAAADSLERTERMGHVIPQKSAAGSR